MRIQRQTSGDIEIVTLEGRLDSTWAEHVEHALKDVIASGRHHMRIDLAGVKYMSSAGLAVLVSAYREVRELDGTFSMENVADTVRHVLAITGLTFLVDGGPPLAPAGRTPARDPEARRLERAGYALEIYSEPEGEVDASLLSEPFSGSQAPTAASLQSLRVEPNRMSLGIGALGVNAEDGLMRLGDFIALAGCAAVQTPDGAAMPDFVQASGTLVPDVHVLYGIDVRGAITGACRFEASPDAGPVKLSALASELLATSGSDEIALVVVAEAAGLVGATLRQSPAQEDSKVGVYTVPEIREWLSMTPEPEHVRSLALIVGVVSKRAGSALMRQLRPINGESGLQGHFHAAVFGYRPLKRGRLQLRDARPIVGAGESELFRGFCWTGPVR